MNFLLELALGQLDLTDQEKATVEQALPTCKDALTAINNAMPDIQVANGLYQQAQPMVLRGIADFKKAAPPLLALLGDGWVDVATLMAAYSDVKSTLQSNAITANDVQATYNKLYPVVAQLVNDWPKIAPAYQVIMGALARKNQSLPGFVENLVGQSGQRVS